MNPESVRVSKSVGVPTPKKETMMDCMIQFEEQQAERLSRIRSRLYGYIARQQGDFPVGDQGTGEEPVGNMGRMDYLQRLERGSLSEIENMLDMLENIG